MSATITKPRNRIALGVLLGVVITLGLSSRQFGNSLPGFVAANAGDTLWSVAVYLTIAIAVPGWSPLRLGFIALGISVAVEVSQLIEASWLEAARNTTPGRLLLGAGFLWADLGRYLVGALGAAVVDWLLGRGRGWRASPL